MVGTEVALIVAVGASDWLAVTTGVTVKVGVIVAVGVTVGEL
jgi:hypothetical protein